MCVVVQQLAQGIDALLELRGNSHVAVPDQA
jgi:hypothetical protein